MSNYDKNTVHKTQLLDQVSFNKIYSKKGTEAGPMVTLFDEGTFFPLLIISTVNIRLLLGSNSTHSSEK